MRSLNRQKLVHHVFDDTMYLLQTRPEITVVEILTRAEMLSSVTAQNLLEV